MGKGDKQKGASGAKTGGQSDADRERQEKLRQLQESIAQQYSKGKAEPDYYVRKVTPKPDPKTPKPVVHKPIAAYKNKTPKPPPSNEIPLHEKQSREEAIRQLQNKFQKNYAKKYGDAESEDSDAPNEAKKSEQAPEKDTPIAKSDLLAVLGAKQTPAPTASRQEEDNPKKPSHAQSAKSKKDNTDGAKSKPAKKPPPPETESESEEETKAVKKKEKENKEKDKPTSKGVNIKEPPSQPNENIETDSDEKPAPKKSTSTKKITPKNKKSDIETISTKPKSKEKKRTNEDTNEKPRKDTNEKARKQESPVNSGSEETETGEIVKNRNKEKGVDLESKNKNSHKPTNNASKLDDEPSQPKTKSKNIKFQKLVKKQKEIIHKSVSEVESESESEVDKKEFKKPKEIKHKSISESESESENQKLRKPVISKRVKNEAETEPDEEYEEVRKPKINERGRHTTDKSKHQNVKKKELQDRHQDEIRATWERKRSSIKKWIEDGLAEREERFSEPSHHNTKKRSKFRHRNKRPARNIRKPHTENTYDEDSEKDMYLQDLDSFNENSDDSNSSHGDHNKRNVHYHLYGNRPQERHRAYDSDVARTHRFSHHAYSDDTYQRKRAPHRVQPLTRRNRRIAHPLDHHIGRHSATDQVPYLSPRTDDTNAKIYQTMSEPSLRYNKSDFSPYNLLPGVSNTAPRYVVMEQVQQNNGEYVFRPVGPTNEQTRTDHQLVTYNQLNPNRTLPNVLGQSQNTLHEPLPAGYSVYNQNSGNLYPQQQQSLYTLAPVQQQSLSNKQTVPDYSVRTERQPVIMQLPEHQPQANGYPHQVPQDQRVQPMYVMDNGHSNDTRNGSSQQNQEKVIYVENEGKLYPAVLLDQTQNAHNMTSQGTNANGHVVTSHDRHPNQPYYQRVHFLVDSPLVDSVPATQGVETNSYGIYYDTAALQSQAGVIHVNNIGVQTNGVDVQVSKREKELGEETKNLQHEEVSHIIADNSIDQHSKYVENGNSFTQKNVQSSIIVNQATIPVSHHQNYLELKSPTAVQESKYHSQQQPAVHSSTPSAYAKEVSAVLNEAQIPPRTLESAIINTQRQSSITSVQHGETLTPGDGTTMGLDAVAPGPTSVEKQPINVQRLSSHNQGNFFVQKQLTNNSPNLFQGGSGPVAPNESNPVISTHSGGNISEHLSHMGPSPRGANQSYPKSDSTIEPQPIPAVLPQALAPKKTNPINIPTVQGRPIVDSAPLEHSGMDPVQNINPAAISKTNAVASEVPKADLQSTGNDARDLKYQTGGPDALIGQSRVEQPRHPHTTSPTSVANNKKADGQKSEPSHKNQGGKSGNAPKKEQMSAKPEPPKQTDTEGNKATEPLPSESAMLYSDSYAGYPPVPSLDSLTNYAKVLSHVSKAMKSNRKSKQDIALAQNGDRIQRELSFEKIYKEIDKLKYVYVPQSTTETHTA
ncbi:uncharacterized protein LOC106171695 [Lingula anatina]|uniref:Uncharacterized protein LOC106171695 n=1 Tax=Lingula anatina TaxID=7574 RepID=A0A1S3JCI5_LINAN|nr:uncharacterized protein LOC106171695 [Lingula anatina]|eukprot:XP_013407594.1 uncharacterized protein LOC106171695 [Lingula anatina]